MPFKTIVPHESCETKHTFLWGPAMFFEIDVAFADFQAKISLATFCVDYALYQFPYFISGNLTVFFNMLINKYH